MVPIVPIPTHGRFKDMAGEQIGFLTVIGYAGQGHRGRNGQIASMWLCRCVCGDEKVVSRSNLLNPRSSRERRSCGCLGLPKGPEARFWRWVKKGREDECWLWTGTMAPDGYGHLTSEQKPWRAHRFSFFLANGSIPAGMLVCHRCDTPLCVNPAHLFLGTPRSNMEDRSRKGRSAHKLDAERVIQMRRDKAAGMTDGRLAKKYRVAIRTVSQITTGKVWKHLLADPRSPQCWCGKSGVYIEGSTPLCEDHMPVYKMVLDRPAQYGPEMKELPK